MSKQSIRSLAIAMFGENIGQRKSHGDKVFRKGVILGLVEQTGCTIPAASTHYNFAKDHFEKISPELCIGLGRPPEKNNGGRKKKVVVAQPKYFQPSNILLLGYTPAPVNLDALLQAPLTPLLPVAEEKEPEPKLYKVVRCKDTSVVAEGLSKEDAEALIEKAVAGKKAKLMMI